MLPVPAGVEGCCLYLLEFRGAACTCSSLGVLPVPAGVEGCFLYLLELRGAACNCWS